MKTKSFIKNRLLLLMLLGVSINFSYAGGSRDGDTPRRNASERSAPKNAEGAPVLEDEFVAVDDGEGDAKSVVDYAEEWAHGLAKKSGMSEKDYKELLEKISHPKTMEQIRDLVEDAPDKPSWMQVAQRIGDLAYIILPYDNFNEVRNDKTTTVLFLLVVAVASHWGMDRLFSMFEGVVPLPVAVLHTPAGYLLRITQIVLLVALFNQGHTYFNNK